jgi:hypothetical protein
MSFVVPAADPNIVINTPTIDLSPFTSQAYFYFVAPGTMTVNGSVTFTGFAQPLLSTLLLEAGALSIVSGATLEAEVEDFILLSGGDMSLNQVNLANTAGNINVTATGALDVQNGSFNAANTGGGSVNLTGPSGITVNGANITTDPVNGSVYLDSTSGSVSVSGTSIQAGFLTLYSGDGILLDGTGATFTGSGPYSSVNLTATTFISVNNADFTSYSTVNMASHTINLQNVAFNGTGAVNLASYLGVANFGSSVVGDVNFIGGVTYGGKSVISDLVNPILGQVNLASTAIRITTSGF